MGEKCKKCKDWEKHYYWKHFSPTRVRFLKVMTGVFSHRMKIPKKFITHFKVLLSEVVYLRGPSGNIWKVRLSRTSKHVFLKCGWEEFLQDHQVKRDNILIFEYKSNSSFHVSIFDKRGYEKICSFFPKNKPYFMHRGCQVKKERTREAAKSSKLSSFSEDDDDDEAVKSSKLSSSSEDDDEVVQSSKLSSSDDDEDYEPLRASSSNAKRKLRSGFSKQMNGHIKKKPSGNYPCRKTYYSPEFKSQRRPVTDAERKRAMDLARAFEVANPSFISVMKPTHVYKRFFMAVPMKFADKYMSPNPRSVTLRLPGGTEWCVSYRRQQGSHFLTCRAWKDFVLDNNLEEGDACVFELIISAGENMVMEVHIFRVVEKVVPTIQVSGSSNQMQHRKQEPVDNFPGKRTTCARKLKSQM